ncbi:MAG: alkylated DNA repair protein [Rhizobiales bacterium PAR1]|nr:MAG: alkylated DNA repair protein [Rhizobiales bacterium PAR1]
MAKVIKALIVLAALGLAGAYVVTDPATHRALFSENPGALPASVDLANGETMFYAGGCASCHATPGQGDRLKLGGGLGLHSPFGTFYAPNISSHATDGIGAWSLESFIRAMREGVSPEGKHYFPAFPYTSYQRMGAKDLADLFGFMKKLAPVEGRVRDHDLPFPFNIRRLVGGWKLLHLDGKLFHADAAKDAAFNRGAYLVDGPGHCAECHSPRNPLGGLIRAKLYSGGPDPEGKGFVPNITPHADGIASWSKGDLRDFLKTGETPSFYSAGGSMASVIKNMSHLSDEDRAAMGAYLAALPAIPGKAPPKK